MQARWYENLPESENHVLTLNDEKGGNEGKKKSQEEIHTSERANTKSIIIFGCSKFYVYFLKDSPSPLTFGFNQTTVFFMKGT